MTTIDQLCGRRSFVGWAFMLAGLLLVAPTWGQTGKSVYSRPNEATPSNPRAGTGNVRQVAGEATPDNRQVYGPQPVAPIKEPGAGGKASPQMPLPSGQVVPNQGMPNQGAPRNPAAAPSGVAPLRAPSWFPLPPEHDKWLDDILAYWEQKSDKIERYECKFKRWEYDPVFGPKPGADGNDVAKSYSEGVLQYKKPDKGNFEVTLTKVYTAPKTEDGKPTYEKQADEMNEHWVCDGKSVFEFDGRKRQLIERPLPPEMQGKSIADGPLPFMFGAKASTIKARYWIRVNTPEVAKNEYWLEAYPKNRADSVNFQRVQVVIDEKDFLPKKLILYAPNFDTIKNPARTAYAFEERNFNWSELQRKLLAPFEGAFEKPRTPFGWKKVIDKPDAVSQGPPPVENTAKSGNPSGRPAATTPGTQAARPQSSKSVK